MKSHKGADMDVSWNPWHGCKKISEGCRHCYVYRTDEKHGRDGSLLSYNKDFDLPVRRKKNGEYKVPSGYVLRSRLSSRGSHTMSLCFIGSLCVNAATWTLYFSPSV